MGTALVFGLLYLLPTFIVLSNENKKSKGPTIVVNIFLGWSGIGWVVALALAVGRD